MSFTRRVLAAIALLCLAALPARADTTPFQLSSASGWLKIAAAGQTVDVQVTSVNAGPVVLTTSTGAPAMADGQSLTNGEHRCWTLDKDLYGSTNSAFQGSVAKATVEVSTVTSCGGGAASSGSPANPATIYTAQVKIATTGTAVPLPTVAGANGFTVRSKTNNTGVGSPALDCVGPAGVTNTSDGTGNGDCEPPGSGWAFGVSSAGAIYVNGAAGDVFFVSGN